MNKRILVVLIFAVAGQLPTTYTAHCGEVQNITHAKIPDYKTLMSLSDFETHVVDNQMGEMYFAIPRPPAFAPDINYFSRITKIAGTSNYLQSTDAETPVQNAQCARGEKVLKPVPMTDRALFMRENSGTVQAMWSSCPTRYLWSMRCANYYFGQRKCLLSEAMFGVYVHGSLDDVPMNDIVQDLCRATGVKFGAQNFKWFFSYGENTLC